MLPPTPPRPFSTALHIFGTTVQSDLRDRPYISHLKISQKGRYPIVTKSDTAILRRTISRRPRINGPNSGRLRICLHMITFGDSRGQPEIPMPVLICLDLSRAQAPPRHLQQTYTGASFELARSFFSLPGHENLYHNCLRLLKDKLDSRLADP